MGGFEDDAQRGETPDRWLDEFKEAVGGAWPPTDLLDALRASDFPPTLAIAAALTRPDWIAPEVLAAMAQVTAGEMLSDEADRLMFRGLFLLGAGHHTPAFRPLLSMLRALGDRVHEVLGDAATDGLQRILAGLYDGELELLAEALLDPTVETYGRAALVEAATTLAWKKVVSREDLVGLLMRAETALLHVPDHRFWFAWSHAVELLALHKMVPAVERAYADGRITPEISDIDEFRSGFAEAEAALDEKRFERARLGFVTDVLEELRRFEQTDEDPAWTADKTGYDFGQDFQEPIRNPLRGIGRNDPCPCGSARKYKKCCLDQPQTDEGSGRFTGQGFAA